MQQITNDLSQLAAIFGDISSSEDEKDINIMDSGEEDSAKELSATDFSLAGMTDTNMSNMSGDADSSDLHIKLQELGRQLDAIQKRRNEIQIELSVEDDPNSKNELEAEEEALKSEEILKKNEYEILASMLNQ